MKIRIETISDLPEDEIILRCRDVDDRIMQLKNFAESLSPSEEIAFYKDNTRYYVSADDILFFESGDRTVYAHTVEDVFQVKYKLFELEQLLPRKFLRISKSAIVNVKKIYSVEKNITSVCLVSFEGTVKHIYVSRGYVKLLRQRLGERRYL